MPNISPIGRLSYPALFKPSDPMQGSTEGPKFKCTLLFPKQMDEKDKAAFDQMKRIAHETAVKNFGPNPKGLRNPFRDGDVRFEEREGNCPEYQGMVFVGFKCQITRPPQIVDQKGRPITEDSGKIYAGCWVRVSYGCYPFDRNGNKGVGFSLGNVQLVRDDTAFDNRTTAEQDFGPPQGDEGTFGSDIFG